MPTADEFRAAKRDAEDALSTLRDIAADVERVYGQTGFVGATLQGTVNDAIVKAFGLKRQAAESGDQLLAELERRAQVCDQHAATLRNWENRVANAVDDEARAAIGNRPWPPYSWVEPR